MIIFLVIIEILLCMRNLQNVFALDSDVGQFYVLKGKCFYKDNPLLFESKQPQSARREEAGNYLFCNRCLFAKQSDNTVQSLRKTTCIELMFKTSSDCPPDNPNDVMPWCMSSKIL